MIEAIAVHKYAQFFLKLKNFHFTKLKIAAHLRHKTLTQLRSFSGVAPVFSTFSDESWNRLAPPSLGSPAPQAPQCECAGGKDVK